MYPVTPTRKTPVTFFPITAKAITRLLALCVVIAVVPIALYVRVNSMDSKAAVTVQASGRGKPYFNFRDGQEMRVDYRGEQNLTEALRAGVAQPRSLASIVLAGDAVPDLIAGYAYNGMGIVTVQHGNPDAFAPKDDSVYSRMQQGYNPDSLLPVVDTYLVPESPDFLQVGDFNHDNRKDVLFAARGGGLFLLAGDGLGGLKESQQISLPGSVTAMTAGQFRAADSWTDIAVGVAGPSGPALLIFDGANELSDQPLTSLAHLIMIHFRMWPWLPAAKSTSFTVGAESKGWIRNRSSSASASTTTRAIWPSAIFSGTAPAAIRSPCCRMTDR